MSESLVMWVIYQSPSDVPAPFVVRPWAIGGASARPSANGRTAATIEEARALVPPGLVNIGRRKDDDPVIAEVWI